MEQTLTETLVEKRLITPLHAAIASAAFRSLRDMVGRETAAEYVRLNVGNIENAKRAAEERFVFPGSGSTADLASALSELDSDSERTN